MVTRVFLVDDQALVRGGFRMLIEAEDDLEVVGEASDGQEALNRLRTVTADVVLMDVRMPVLDGVGTTRRLLADGNPARVLRHRFVPDVIAGLQRIAWWDWPHERIGGAMQDFRKLGAEAFCAKHG